MPLGIRLVDGLGIYPRLVMAGYTLQLIVRLGVFRMKTSRSELVTKGEAMAWVHVD